MSEEIVVAPVISIALKVGLIDKFPPLEVKDVAAKLLEIINVLDP